MGIEMVNTKAHEFVIFDPENKGKSSCHGDSGGPLFFNEKDGSKTIIGITSRAYSKEEDCSGRSIYTDVRPYIQWIQEKKKNMKQGSQKEETSPWYHKNLSSSGNWISIDYQLKSLGASSRGQNIWINIGGNISSQDKIEILFENKEWITHQEKVNMEYVPSENKFTGRFKEIEKANIRYNGRYVFQKLQIFINGSPLKEAQSGLDYFKIEM